MQTERFKRLAAASGVALGLPGSLASRIVLLRHLGLRSDHGQNSASETRVSPCTAGTGSARAGCDSGIFSNIILVCCQIS